MIVFPFRGVPHGRVLLPASPVLFASIKELDELSFRIEYAGPDAKELDACGFTGAKQSDACNT
ncbi:MAG TPA: hypothetical protein VE961_26460 [Pyrinomonadaceae bacterium]|nr:hypothetical protein [Pyrinomonadaceae bacterium]